MTYDCIAMILWYVHIIENITVSQDALPDALREHMNVQVRHLLSPEELKPFSTRKIQMYHKWLLGGLRRQKKVVLP